MKYTKLTKEQFESLHTEFAQFLATQKIDIDQWKTIKSNNPSLVEEELNIFSDLVWEDVLTKVTFVEHISKSSINLFKTNQESISRIVIKVEKKIDLLNQKDYQWLVNNPKDDSIHYFKGEKKYQSERNQEIFNLIEQGSYISDGQLFEYFNKLIS